MGASSSKSPLPGTLPKLHLVSAPGLRDDADELEFRPIDSISDPLDVLDKKTYKAGDTVQLETDLPSKRFLEIVEGFAKETIYRDNRCVGEVDLQPGNIIGMTRFARVEAITTLVVRIIDFDDLAVRARDGDMDLFVHALERQLDMALNDMRINRQRSADLAEDLAEAERREIAVMRRFDQLKRIYDGKIARRMGELVGVRIKRLRDENKRLRDDKARFEKDIEADLKSQASVLQSVRIIAEQQDEEIAELQKEKAELQKEKAELQEKLNAIKKLSGNS